MKLKNQLPLVAFIAASSLAFAACDDTDDQDPVVSCEEDPTQERCNNTTPTCEEDPTQERCNNTTPTCEEDPSQEGCSNDPAEPTDAEKKAAAPAAWRAENATPVSPEQATVITVDGRRISAVVDARAGGTAAANSNSWSYIDIHEGDDLGLSDVESFQNSEWDFAIRRTGFRINSGHSGPGQIEIARLTGANFDMVHEVPADVEWATDELTWQLVTNVDPDTDEETKAWQIVREPFGFPWAAINEVNSDHEPSLSWYSYGGPGGLDSVYEHIYLLRDGDGKTFKLQIRAYAGAIWTFRWEELVGECNATVANVDVDGSAMFARRVLPYDYYNDASDTYNTATTSGAVTTIHVGVGAGGSGPSTGFAFNYFDLAGNFPLTEDEDTGDDRQINDFEAADREDWVFGFRRQVMVLNGGDYGPGDWEIARALDTNFAGVMELPSGLKWETEFGRFRWSADDTPVCKPYAGFYGGMHRAMDEINYDRSPMATWYRFKAGTFADAEPYPNVVYFLRNKTEEKAYVISIDEIVYNPLADGQTGSGTRNARMVMRTKALPWN